MQLWQGAGRRLARLLGPSAAVDTLSLLGVPNGISQAPFERVTVHERSPLHARPPARLAAQFAANYRGEYFPQRCFPETWVAELPGGISSAEGATCTASGQLIAAATFEFGVEDGRSFRIFRKPQWRPPVHTCAGRVATLTARWQDNVFHWLFDILPRLYLLALAGARYDRLYVSLRHRYQRESLQLLGYADGRCIDAAETPFVAADRLIVPSLPGVPGIPPGWVCQWLRDRFLGFTESACGPERLYVSRADATGRRLRNRQQVERRLHSAGFVSVILSDFAFIEQIALFHSAQIVVGAHGAGLANVVFCPPGARLLELFSPATVNPCYFDVCDRVGVEYDYLIGRDAEDGATADGDIIVDLPALDRRLLEFERQAQERR